VNARPDYSRMPGPGDLPGDNTNPNSPDYVEPAFDESEAMWSVAKSMDPDDVAEILIDLADTAGLLATLQKAPGLTSTQHHRLEMLAHHARQMGAKRDREYRVLNGGDR
jgi:hypothetical protein